MKHACIFLGAIAVFSLVRAQSSGGDVFDRFDRNRDGKVTRDELPNAAAFDRFDGNRDGTITREEYTRVAGAKEAAPSAAAGARAIDAVVRQFDADADGKITREEAAGASWFNRVDTNADGVIDAAELEVVRRLAARGGAGRGALPGAMPAITEQDVQKVTSGPEVLKPGDAGVGRMVPDVVFTDLAGRAQRLGDVARAHKAVVVAMTSATCPVSKRYLPSLTTLEKELAAQDVALVLVNPFASETAAGIRAQLAAHHLKAAYVHDKDQAFATALRARTTTEVFLLDAARTVVYRGALDDQYGIDYNLDAPRHSYLRDAIAALLRNQTPAVQATAAPGCELDLDAAQAAAAPPVTYHRDVARILQQNCVTCHRDGGIAPFALDDLAAVKERARTIKRVVREGTMPPWFAAPPPDGAASPWANDRSLSPRDRDDLLAWIDSKDRAAGDPADAPVKRAFPAEWSIGTPDVILPLSRAYDIKATGFMPYQFDVVQTEFTEDKWVSAYEIRPSERDVVHHVIVQVHERGADARDREEGAGGYWAVYVPGNGAHTYPDGFARRIPAGAKVSFQIHYTPSGTAKQERLRMGLVFASTPPLYEVKTVPIAHPRLAIPPGAAHHVETRAQRVPFDLPVTSFMAHMHVRGKAFNYEVTYPDGRTETLLDIPRYDFNWQLRYDLKRPKLLPRGSTVKVTAVYDNSAANRANPDPAKLVRWGSQTVDEMMIGYLEYFTPLSPPVADAGAPRPGTAQK